MDLSAEKTGAVNAIKGRCFAARIKPSDLCVRAGVARSTLWRAERDPEKVSVQTIGKLEGALDALEAERAKSDKAAA